tara:strand:- start:47 stop:1006 length:960 start_codon:yes stop_codon:yes gene_type:complete
MALKRVKRVAKFAAKNKDKISRAAKDAAEKAREALRKFRDKPKLNISDPARGKSVGVGGKQIPKPKTPPKTPPKPKAKGKPKLPANVSIPRWAKPKPKPKAAPKPRPKVAPKPKPKSKAAPKPKATPKRAGLAVAGAGGVGYSLAKPKNYSVKSGDTLSQIAKREGISLKDVKAANPNIKDLNKIRAGQKIKLPRMVLSKNTPYKGMTKAEMAALSKVKKKMAGGIVNRKLGGGMVKKKIGGGVVKAGLKYPDPSPEQKRRNAEQKSLQDQKRKLELQRRETERDQKHQEKMNRLRKEIESLGGTSRKPVKPRGRGIKI